MGINNTTGSGTQANIATVPVNSQPGSIGPNTYGNLIGTYTNTSGTYAATTLNNYGTLTSTGSIRSSTGYIQQHGTCVSIHAHNGSEIVRIDNTGIVTWDNNINIDAAAEAFGQAIKMGAEFSAGLTAVKQIEIRNNLFEEIIQVAKEEGPLDADKLAFMLRSCKIMDKLKEK